MTSFRIGGRVFQEDLTGKESHKNDHQCIKTAIFME